MATVAQIQSIAAMTEAEVAALAYLEAAGGDAHCALSYAIEDLLRAEHDITALQASVSHGYVRAVRVDDQLVEASAE
ncbi:hypothetical protein ASG52_11650 [Methylobacterium sp. Leaf456]|uniref:hypothetical protein n=1 Tax=Methylobacterium sp. Leaf456 TaxID=1736382 RepID=UPI0007001BDD|nr:hypothetical protein [Methylobacterium sp. Leaf456]KQT47906.1 hypothetical protein ASG52_11650 [Methylobacterium sp. Leaf456]